MSKTLISVRGVSKIYRLYDDPRDRMREALSLRGKSYHRNFMALDDVSFDVRKGESLGVIGKNGQGKSTLLKVIAGSLQPTSGTVSVRGRIAAILELSSNLNREITGRANVALGLRIAGVAADEREGKVSEIIDFADIGEFIDQPVKNFSTGMRSRLAFALATSVVPDILILDEVLAVGDFEFQQKCLARIRAMRERMSILFVSHSMNLVRNFCDNAIVLEGGRNAFHGKSEDAIAFYAEAEATKRAKIKSNRNVPLRPFYGEIFANTDKVDVRKHGWTRTSGIKVRDTMRFDFEFQLKCVPKKLIIGVPIWSVDTEKLVTSILSDFENVPVTVQDGTCKGSITIQCPLNPGAYLSSFNVRDGVEFLYKKLNAEFTVTDSRRVFGVFTSDASWSFD